MVTHSWDGFFDKQKMGDGVHVEQPADVSFRFVEDRLFISDSAIVDQYCRLTVGFRIVLQGRLHDIRSLWLTRQRFIGFLSQNNQFPLHKHTSLISILIRFPMICLYRGSTVFRFRESCAD